MVTSTTSGQESLQVCFRDAHRSAKPMGDQGAVFDPAVHLPRAYLQVVGDVIDGVEDLCLGSLGHP
jgi:hypothetical protein